MALSKDDQRTLDEMERTLLAEDPAFVNAVSFDRLRRHRVIVGSTAFLLATAVLVVGAVISLVQVAVGVVVCLIGFVAMVAAVAWSLRLISPED